MFNKLKSLFWHFFFNPSQIKNYFIKKIFFDIYRSSASFNSSEMSHNKKADSGLGSTSNTSESANNPYIVKKVELLEELKNLLKLSNPSTKSSRNNFLLQRSDLNSSSSNNNDTADDEEHANQEFTSEMHEENKSVVSNSKPSITTNTMTTRTTRNCVQNDYDVDLIMHKAIQYIKKLQKIKKIPNEGIQAFFKV